MGGAIPDRYHGKQNESCIGINKIPSTATIIHAQIVLKPFVTKNAQNGKKGFDSLIMWSYNAPPPTVWRHLFAWFVGFKGRTFLG